MRQDIENLRTVQEHFQSPPRVKETATTAGADATDVKATAVPAAAAATPPPPPPNTTTAPSTTTTTPGAPVVMSETEHEMREEIERLKRERKKLMDTGNELRSALLKAQVKESEETQEYLEHLRDENVGTVYQWIRGRPEAASGRDRSRSRSRSVGRDDYFNHLRDPPTRPRPERFFQMMDDDHDTWNDEQEDHQQQHQEDVRRGSDSRYDETAVEDLSMEDAYGSAPSSYAALDMRRPPSAAAAVTVTAAPRRLPIDTNKPQTAIRRRLEDPMAVVGNAVPASRAAPRSGIYPATRPLSAGPNRSESSTQGTRHPTNAFVVHKVPPGGYVTTTHEPRSTTLGRSTTTTSTAANRSATTRSTPGQEQALERLRKKQQTAEERIEEEIRLAKSKVVNYAALKSRDENA